MIKKADSIAFNKENVATGLSHKGYGRTYFAKKDFKPKEEIMHGYGRITHHQTSHKSVQIGPKTHYVPEKWTGAYWNHSCDPNAYMRTRPGGFPSLYALKKIRKGAEITYAYSMSEFTWSSGAKENKVICRCDTKSCKKKILAFSQLSRKEQKRLRDRKLCADYLCKMVV